MQLKIMLVENGEIMKCQRLGNGEMEMIVTCKRMVGVYMLPRAPVINAHAHIANQSLPFVLLHHKLLPHVSVRYDLSQSFHSSVRCMKFMHLIHASYRGMKGL